MFKVQKMYSKLFVTVDTYKEAVAMAREAAKIHAEDTYIISEEKNGRWYRRDIIGHTYEVIPRSTGYEIRKKNGNKWLYLIKVYNGEYTWGSDYTYSKIYTTFKAAQDSMVLIESRRA